MQLASVSGPIPHFLLPRLWVGLISPGGIQRPGQTEKRENKRHKVLSAPGLWLGSSASGGPPPALGGSHLLLSLGTLSAGAGEGGRGQEQERSRESAGASLRLEEAGLRRIERVGRDSKQSRERVWGDLGISQRREWGARGRGRGGRFREDKAQRTRGGKKKR